MPDSSSVWTDAENNFTSHLSLQRRSDKRSLSTGCKSYYYNPVL